ncbi:uncharacterized protein BDR25DRAFT_36659 [Lindgomyces ingoldianus]|uniref:Uncharacterized protein n=1 Tax=Lindgomyces ingoldianus TaxID=673940 RepID=A0ACB6QVJ4_9PLEO|nr:uncharacterized protein BDR25DRAFT_36659 [Lindgomyces ingoldianus]KAF2470092.1 hypothetical protein BDR25DRAFT_36659 [Lindgomyces ingoldianus]
MPLHRRFTARNALIALLVWLFLALLFHLKAELWPSPVEPSLTSLEPSNDDHREPIPHDNGGNKAGETPAVAKRRTAVVVASQQLEDATWLDEYFPRWEKNIYRVDDKSAPLTVPKNKGRESMVYLTFIIDNFDKLPDNILFLHPNRYQWHNDDPDYDGLPMLRHFQIPYLEKEGYVNIRCAWSLGCPSEIKPIAEEGEHRAAVHAGGDYKQGYEALFPGKQVPSNVGVSCCAQFAATKEKVLERPKSDYVRYREWLVDTPLDDSISGRIFEYSWHMIFGKEPVHCPTAKECYCKVFGFCYLECQEDGNCAGRYELPRFSTLPNGWPFIGWKGEERNRSAPEE